MPFYSWKIFHCMNILRCVYPLIHGWIFPKRFLNRIFLLWIRPPPGNVHGGFPLTQPSERPASSLIHRGSVGSRHGGGRPPISPKTTTLTPPTIHGATPSSPEAHGISRDLWTAQEPYCWEISTVKVQVGRWGRQLLNLLVKCEGKLFPFFRFAGCLGYFFTLSIVSGKSYIYRRQKSFSLYPNWQFVVGFA